MRSIKLLLPVLALLLIATISFSTPSDGIEFDVSEPEIFSNNVVPDNGTTEAEQDNTIWGSIEAAFGKIIDAFVGVITVPFTVTISVFTKWGDTLGTTWGPIIGGIVIFVLYLLVRIAFQTDKFFDLFS